MSTKSCVICGGAEPEGELLVAAPCRSHWVCPDDVSAFFERATDSESLFPPKCCGQIFMLSEYEDYVPFDIAWQYQVKEQGEYSVLAKFRIYCGDPSCAEFLHPSSQITDPLMSVTYAICSSGACGKTTCTGCKILLQNGTQNHVCKTDENEAKFKQTVTEKGYQECEVCGATVELTEACNHITCECGNDFCYICGQPWPGVHGCPHYGPAIYDEESYNQDGYHRDTGLNRASLTHRQENARLGVVDDEDDDDEDNEERGEDWDVMQHLEAEQRIAINVLQGEAREDALDQLRIMLFETRGLFFGQGNDDGEDGNEEGEGEGGESDNDEEEIGEEEDGNGDDTSELGDEEPAAPNAPNALHPMLPIMFPGPFRTMNNIAGRIPALFDGAATPAPNAELGAGDHGSTATGGRGEGGAADHRLGSVDEAHFAVHNLRHSVDEQLGDGNANPRTELAALRTHLTIAAAPLEATLQELEATHGELQLHWLNPELGLFERRIPHPEAASHDNADLYSNDAAPRPGSLFAPDPTTDPHWVHPYVPSGTVPFRNMLAPSDASNAAPNFPPRLLPFQGVSFGVPRSSLPPARPVDRAGAYRGEASSALRAEESLIQLPNQVLLAEWLAVVNAGAGAGSNAASPATEIEDAGPVTPEEGESEGGTKKEKGRMWRPPWGWPASDDEE